MAAGTKKPARSFEFYAIFAISFSIFLVVVLAVRCLPTRWRPRLVEASAARSSVIGEARAAAGTITPFAFMA